MEGSVFDWSSFLSPVVLSLKVSFAASLAVIALGTAAAWFLTRKRFKGRTLVETAIMLPLVLPPTAVGFFLLVLLGRGSWLGRLYERLAGHPALFTWGAAAAASVVVAFPLVYQTMKTGFASVDGDLLDAGRSEGATERQLLRWITLPLVKRSLATAYLLGFARSLGEFGATLMVAGNIPDRTQTVPTAIYVAVESGNMEAAWWWAGALVVLSFLLLLATGGRK